MKPMWEWGIGVLMMGIGVLLFYQGSPDLVLPQMAIATGIILAGGLAVTHSVVMTT